MRMLRAGSTWTHARLLSSLLPIPDNRRAILKPRLPAEGRCKRPCGPLGVPPARWLSLGWRCCAAWLQET